MFVAFTNILHTNGYPEGRVVMPSSRQRPSRHDRAVMTTLTTPNTSPAASSASTLKHHNNRRGTRQMTTSHAQTTQREGGKRGTRVDHIEGYVIQPSLWSSRPSNTSPSASFCDHNRRRRGRRFNSLSNAEFLQQSRKNFIEASSGHRLTAFQKALLNSTAKCPVEALKVCQSSTVAAYAFNQLSNGQFSMDCHKNWKATSSGSELTASQTASTNSAAKALIYVFKNRRSSSAAAYAFNQLSSGQFHSNRRQTREKRSSGSTLRLSCPPCWVSIVKCLVDATKSRQTDNNSPNLQTPPGWMLSVQQSNPGADTSSSTVAESNNSKEPKTWPGNRSRRGQTLIPPTALEIGHKGGLVHKPPPHP